MLAAVVSVTVIGVLVVVLVVLAAVGGWASSGVTRLGRELGFVLGLLVGLAVARLVAPHPGDRFGALVVLLVAGIGGGLLGASLVGGVGHHIARGLARLRLDGLDRLLGALLSGIGALILCALVLHLLVLLDPASGLVHAARRDVLAQWLIHNQPLVWL